MKSALYTAGVAILCASALTLASSFLPMQAAVVNAQQPTQAQMEQFKRLPRAQQEALARQYGIDISLFDRQSTNGAAQEELEPVEPRRIEGNDNQGERTGSKGDTEREDEREIKPFGYNLFAGTPNTFAQLNNSPVPGNYRIGAGDSILVQFFGQESINYTLVVDREGRVTIPRLGPLTVAGLSYNELKELISNQVSTRMIGMQVAVSMGELRSMQIFVLGEAQQPGAYTVGSLTTVSQALFASGGLSEIASLRNIQLKRSGETIVEFDLYDLLIHGDASKDRILQPGDAVFIPARGPMVKIHGEVLRPAIYELKGSETLADLVAIAGGALPSAFQGALQVHRAQDGQRLLQTIDGTLDSGKNLRLQAGDEIRVPRISEVIDNTIRISGSVTRPGRYEFREGLRINDFVVNVTQDLSPDADLSYGLVIREEASSRDIEILQFDVYSALQGVSEHNLELRNRDQVLFFNRFERERDRARAGFGENAGNAAVVDEDALVINSRARLLESVLARLQAQETQDASARFVRVSGEVRYPGTYPLAQNTSVPQLIAAAGGLRDSAYLSRAEITRTVIENNGEISNTEYIPFNLFDVIAGSSNIEIKSRDRLNIFRIPDWQDTVDVTLDGEVRFPGTYAVGRGETLLDVVERAGGLTDYAFVEGAVLTREEIREQERRRLEALSQELRQEMASTSLTEGGVTNYGELNQLLNDLSGAEPVGRLVVDLAQILSGDVSRDIELRDGDRLVVPGQRRTISIIGEVQMPSTYRYDESLSVIDYIERTGGIKRRGDDKRIFVVRADGSVMPYAQRRGWFSSTGRVDLRPGDTIVVPLNTSYKDNLELWATSTQILYQMAVAIAAVNSI